MNKLLYFKSKNRSIGARFIAFVLMLAMMAGISPAVLAEGEGTGEQTGGSGSVLSGSVTIKNGSKTITTVGTGEVFTIEALLNTKDANSSEEFDIRLYLNINGLQSGEKIQDYIRFASTALNEGSGQSIYQNMTYELKQDENGKYYIAISNVPSGVVTDFEIQAMFKPNISLDGQRLELELKKGTEQAQPLGIGRTPTADVTVVADPVLKNYKSADKTSLEYDDQFDTITGKSIKYSINIAPDNAWDPIGKNDTAVTSYTVTDVVTLPEGLYIAESDLSAAYVISGISPVVTVLSGSGGSVTSFKVEFTVNRTDTANANGSYTTQMAEGNYSAVLNGAYIHGTQNYIGGTITNKVQTSYTHRILTPEGILDNETAAALPEIVSTVLSPAGSGIGSASKNLNELEYEDVCEGDIVSYTIKVENDTDDAKSYRVEDALSSFGLEFYRFVGAEGIAANSYSSASAAGDSTYTFSIDIPGKTTAGITFEARVKGNHEHFSENNDTYYIENVARVTVLRDGSDRASVDVVAPRVVQKVKSPSLELTKTAGNNVKKYKSGVPFSYTVTLTNTGNEAATDVHFSDPLPAGLVRNGNITVTDQSGNTVSGITYNETTGAFEGSGLTVLPRGGYLTVIIPVMPDENDLPDTIVNTAYADYTKRNPDGTWMDTRTQLEASVPLTNGTVKLTDIKVTKRADYGVVRPGTEVNFTISLENLHEDPYTGDVVVEEIPDSGLIFVRASNTDQTPLKAAGEGLDGEFEIVQIDPDNVGAGHRITLKGGLDSLEKKSFVMTFTTDVAEGLALRNVAGVVGGNMKTVGIEVRDIIFPVTKNARYSMDGGATWSDFIDDGDPIPQGALIEFDIRATNMSNYAFTNYDIFDDLREGNYLFQVLSGFNNATNLYTMTERIKAKFSVYKGNQKLAFSYTDKVNDNQYMSAQEDIDLLATWQNKNIWSEDGKCTQFSLRMRTGGSENESSYADFGTLTVFAKTDAEKAQIRLEPGESINVRMLVSSDTSAQWLGGMNKVKTRVNGVYSGEDNISYIQMDDEIEDEPLEVKKTATFRDANGNLKTVGSDEIGVIPADTDITFNIKVRNKQKTKSVTAYKIEDQITGNYSADTKNFNLSLKKNGELVTLHSFNSTDGWIEQDNPLKDVHFTGGGKLSMVLCQCNSWWRIVGGISYSSITIDQPGDRVVLGPGDEMELSYTIRSASSGWEGGSNTVRVYPGTLRNNQTSNIIYSSPVEDTVTYERAVDVPVLSITKELMDIYQRAPGDTSIDEIAYRSDRDISPVLLDASAEGKDIVYTYKVRLENNSNEPLNIKNGSSYTDVIPPDMVLYNTVDYKNAFYGRQNDGAKNSVQMGKMYHVSLDKVQSWQNAGALWDLTLGDSVFSINPRDGAATISGRVMTGQPIKLTSKYEMIMQPGGWIEFYYRLAVTKEKVHELRQKMLDSTDLSSYLKDIDLKNTITFDSNGEPFKTVNTGMVGTQASAAAKTTLISEGIHPGIYKEYLGTVSHVGYAANELPNLSAETELVWKVTLYNGYDDKGAPMSNYKVADVMPSYSYSETNWAQELSGIAAVNQIPAYIKIYGYDSNTKQPASEPEAVYNDFLIPDQDGMISFADQKYAVPSGGKAELIIITKPNAGMKHGMYTNKAYLIPDENDVFQDESIIAGTKATYKNKTAILESDNISIHAVYSKSEKKVTSSAGTATSFSKAPDNRVMVEKGETVRYELNIDYNTSEAHDDPSTKMTGLVIIDKLPFVGDMAIGSDGERGSVFEVKYGGNLEIMVDVPKRDGTNGYNTYDITDCATLAYSSQPAVSLSGGQRMQLLESDTDWLPETLGVSDSVYTWVEQPSTSMNMVRFSINKLNSFSSDGANPFAYSSGGETHYGIPAGSKVRVSYDGIIPGYAQKTGRSNVAWNSFAYSYSTEEFENMMAEPAKIGVYIDPSDVSAYGNISVRKVYKSNRMWNRSFRFALYDAPYTEGAQPLMVKELSMSGRPEGAQADTYFDNLPLGKTYYVYESDSSGVPLSADGSGAVTIGGQYAFTADKMMESASLTSESSDAQMTFTNTRIIEPEIKIYGPLYADVPTSKTVGASADMTSTRPTSFGDFEMTADGYNKVKDEKRTASNERENAEYDSRIAGYGGQDVHNHTIATGFLAEISGTADADTVSAVTWTITSTPADGNHTVPVYVRLRTRYAGVAEGTEITERAVLMLNDFAVGFEPESLEEKTADAIGDIASGNGAEQSEASDGISFGGDEGIETIDDEFLRAESIDERAVMIAESLGIDPDKILWNEFNEPYVLLDEEVADKAEYVSDDAARLMDLTETAMTNINRNDIPQTTRKDFESTLEEAGFGDDSRNFDNAYTIFKLTGGTYTWKILDNTLPRMTLSPTSSVYVGLIIDQLYDQHAAASLSLTGDADADRASVAAPKAYGANGEQNGTLRYTHVNAFVR